MREIVFGLEDSLVSTLGVVTGIAAGTGNTFVVILSGVVLIFVEGLSMAAGSYLSSKSAREVFEARAREDVSRMRQERIDDDETLEEMLKRKKFSLKERTIVFETLARERKIWIREVKQAEYRFAPAVSNSPVRSGFVMGVFYLFGGIFPLAPYFFLSVDEAIVPSIILTGAALFALGFWKAKVVGSHVLKSGAEMTLVSLSAALLGFLIGRFVSAAFGITVI